ncbi:MAG: ferrous iron transport protein A [Alphaproteobacteria bacterium]
MVFKNLMQGEIATVCGFNTGNKQFKRRLMSFGLIPGAEFKIVRIAPLGDPVQIEVMGSQIALRKDEADILQIAKKA